MAWEYKVVEFVTLEPRAVERLLNDLGKTRWELVSYFFSDRGAAGMAVLKRLGRETDRRGRLGERRRPPRP
jgi:hypothetical protein